MFYMIKQELFKGYLDEIEEFTMLLSCLAHDLDHTGRSNTFEISKQSKLAIRYNDESVLENHHVSQFFKLIKAQSVNILQNVKPEEYRKIRKFMVSNILGTDMKSHFNIIKDFELKVINHKTLKTKFCNFDTFYISINHIITSLFTGEKKSLIIRLKEKMR